jgi:hypothetical protein
MYIAHQPIIEKEKYLQFRLHQPYWSGYKKYGWAKGVPAIGISEKLVKYAFKVGKHIRVNTQWGNLEISPIKARREARKYQSYFMTKGIKLLEIPRTAFRAIPKRVVIDRIKEEVREQRIDEVQLSLL